MPPAILDNIISASTSAGEELALNIGAEFDRTYQQGYDGIDSWVSSVMSLDNPSQRRAETFGMIESMPVPELWRRGDPIPTEGTGSKRFSIVNYTYAKRIDWHREDREDTLIGDILPRFRTLAKRMALVAPKAATELLTGTASLLPGIPNAPDGADLFNATDGDSNDRFGVSGGNIVALTGVTSGTIETDWFSVTRRFGEFEDTKGEPYFDPNIGAEEYLIIASLVNRKAFVNAFNANIVHSTIAGSSTTDVQTGAGVSNLVMASGANIRMLFTSRLSGNPWYVFRSDAEVKPLFELTRRPIQEESALAETNNSDHTRNTGMEYIQYSRRAGYGVNVPFGAIQVTA